MGARNQTRVFCKSRKCALPLSHLSSLPFISFANSVCSLKHQWENTLVCMCECVHIEARGQPYVPCPGSHLSCFGRHSLSSGPKAQWLGYNDRPMSPPSQYWDPKHRPALIGTCLASYMSARNQTQVFTFVCHALYWLRYLCSSHTFWCENIPDWARWFIFALPVPGRLRQGTAEFVASVTYTEILF